ncbi:MAG TPA: glycosyltransferase family 87 protein [Steroidobacteraceae bacterium]
MFSKLTVSRLQWALTITVWLGLMGCVYSIAADNLSQWDFNVYYSAAHALAVGETPYRPIHPHPGLSGDLIFQYPPLTTFLFYWTNLFSLAAAKMIWLGLKLVAIGVLAWIWRRDFERVDGSWPIALFIALGFNATLLKDFVTGNISTLEQVGIWLGFSMLVRGRPYAAAVLLACVAQFKLLPAAFLVLIPLVRPRDGWQAFLLGCGLFVGLLGLNFLISPGLTHDYLSQFTNANVRMDDRGINNPSSLALFRDIIDLTAWVPGLSYNRDAGTRVYLFYIAALLLILIRAISGRVQRVLNSDPRLIVYSGCTLFAVAMPRMKDYSYILMLIPALFVIRDLRRSEGTQNYLLLALGLMILAQPQQTNVPGLQILIYMLQAYLPLWVAAIVMVYVLRLMLHTTLEFRPAASATARVPTAPVIPDSAAG